MAPECEKTKTCGLNGNYSPDFEAYPVCDAQGMQDLEELDAELEAMLLQNPEALKALLEAANESNLGICRFSYGTWGQYKPSSTIMDRLLTVGAILVGATALSSLAYVFRGSIADGFRSAVDGIKNFFSFNEAKAMDDLRRVQNRVDQVEERTPLIYEADRLARRAEIRKILRENPEKFADLFIRAIGVKNSEIKSASVENMFADKSFAEREALRMEETQRLSESGIRLTPEGLERIKAEARAREARGE